MDAGAPRDVIRALADECLIACAFFERRLRRNGTVRHYVGLGQASYDAASLTEQAYGFVHMRDVIASAATGDAPEDGAVLVDRARAGSQTARAELARQNVVIGPWGGRQARPALALSLSESGADRCPFFRRSARARSSLPNSVITLTRTPAVQLKVKSPDMAMIGPISRHGSGSATFPAPSVV